jgi:uncharacterized protein YjbI with pentapeptide repeats
VPLICPDCDLTGKDFSNQDLTGANLRGARLINTNFAHATLAGADLTGAIISGADFTNCDLSSVVLATPTKFASVPGKPTILTGARIPFAMLGTAWSDLDLRGATILDLPVDLSRLAAVRAKLDGFDFSGRTLKNAQFSNASLTGVIFSRALLQNAVLGGANLTDAKIDSTRLDYAVFFGATLTGATFAGATFLQTDLMQTDMTGTRFNGCDVTTCRFSAPPRFSNKPGALTSFKSGRLLLSTIGLNWSCLDLSTATIVGLDAARDFTGLFATHAVLSGLDLSERTLNGAQLSHATLAGTKLARSWITGAVMTWAVCTDADLSYARLSNTDLSNADLSGATLDSAFFDGTTLAGALLGGVSANGTQFGGLSPAFALDPSQEIALRSDTAGPLIGIFQQHGYSLSPGAQLTQQSGLWLVTDGSRTYTVLLSNASDSGRQLVLYGDRTVSLPLSAIATLNAGPIADIRSLFSTYAITLSNPTLTRGAGVWTLDDSLSGSHYTIRKDDASGGGAKITVFTTVLAAVMNDVYMADAEMRDANLFGVSGDGLQIYGGAILDGAILEQARLPNANLGNMSLKQARLPGVVLSGATLVNAKLNGATLTPSAGGIRANLSNANLQGADFTDATLYGANLTSAAVAVNIGTADAPEGGVWCLTLNASLGAELDRASQLARLTTSASTFWTLQAALDARNIASVAAAMKKAGMPLSATADVTQDAHVRVWKIVSGGEVVFSIFAALDPGGESEYYVKPPSGAQFSLNPDGDAMAFAAIGAALQAANLATLRTYFQAQQQTLPDGARLVAGEQGIVWLIADAPVNYVVWAGLDPRLNQTLYARAALPQVAAAFSAAQLPLRPQAIVTKLSTSNAWILDNDSLNPQNLQLGYMTFKGLRSASGIEIYGTSIRIERLAGRRLQIDVEPCNVTQLKVANLSPDAVCPNRQRLDTNQATPGTTWNDWMRAPQPPAPPLCVPNAYSYCPIDTMRKMRAAACREGTLELTDWPRRATR